MKVENRPLGRVMIFVYKEGLSTSMIVGGRVHINPALYI